jgi:hypothetical protein
MENRGGRKLVEQHGDMCERKNGNGVDPNRNWAVDWGIREKDYLAYEEYAGEAAFSEPEPWILRQLAQDFRPHVWVNVHSGAFCQLLFLAYMHLTLRAMLPLSEAVHAITIERSTPPCM